MKTYCKIAKYSKNQTNVINLTECPCDNPCELAAPAPMKYWSDDELVYLFMHIPQYRQLLEMRFVGRKSVKEISDELKLPMSTIYNRLDRAITKARKFFERKPEVVKYVNEVWRKDQ